MEFVSGVPAADAGESDEPVQLTSRFSLPSSDRATTFLVNDVLRQQGNAVALRHPPGQSDGAPLDGAGDATSPDALQAAKNSTKKKKGALSGVFIPTCENMWGVLIFLRFYFIVGEAGIWQAMCVVILSFAASMCTAASMSSIASSGGLVSQGGPYHMISRSLGPVVGASVGIMYWLALTMLAVLECLGAVESLIMAVPSAGEFPFHVQAIGSGFLAMLALTVWGGVEVVTRLGMVFALVVAYTLYSYYFGLVTAPHHEIDHNNVWVTGLNMDTFWKNWDSHYTPGNSFGTALALFYPCFTGILSGADRADVLKDPPTNIRRGTFAAIMFSFVMYTSLFMLWGAVADFRYLQGDVEANGSDSHPDQLEIGRAIVQHIVWNPFPKSAFIGIIVASLSQSLQCLIVAPRLLQQIAKDDILRILRPFAPLSAHGEPTRALLFTYAVAACLALIGSLDIVAPLLSMCFLVAYAFMNLSCFMLTVLKSPAWRPEWIHMKRWRLVYLFIAGFGYLLCMVIMFTINCAWASVACCFAVMLYGYISWHREARQWGSAMDGIQFRFALNALINLEGSQKQCVNWRPQVLIMYRINVTEELQGIKHREILRFYGQLKKSRGFCVVACVLESQRRDEAAMKRASDEKGIIKGIMAEEGLQGFAEVVVAPTWSEGANYVVQLTGIGGLVPNTVLLDWPESQSPDAEEARRGFVDVLQTALGAEKAILAVKGLRAMPTDAVYGTIDIWWMIHDGGFLILLSWLLSRHRTWRSCQMRVFTIAENVSEDNAKVAAEALSKTLRQRQLLNVDVEVIILDDDLIRPYTFDWTLRVESRHRFLQELGQTNRAQAAESIPYEIDDLFVVADAERTRGVSSASRVGSPRRSTSLRSVGENPVPECFVTVSDCRKPGVVTQRHLHQLGGGASSSDLGRGQPEGVGDRAGGGQECNGRVEVEEQGEHGAVAATSMLSVACPKTTAPADALCVPAVAAGRERRLIFDGDTCERLGQIIHERSKRAELVVMNLPDFWSSEGDEVTQYLRYCDVLTQGLDRVLFVHSTGHEIFDISE